MVLGGSGGKCGLHAKPMSDKGLAIHYTRRNVEKPAAYVVHMRVFGSLAYAIVSDEKWSNLDAKAIKCMFLGYCEGMKGFYR